MKHPHMMKRPRSHKGLHWEGTTLSNEFIDVNRMALDDRYGKVGAPLSKRRNGVGFTDGKTIGLFGLGHVSPVNKRGSQDVLTDKQLDHYFRNQRFLAQGNPVTMSPNYLESSEGYYNEFFDAKDTYGDPPKRTTRMIYDNKTWAVVADTDGTQSWRVVDVLPKSTTLQGDSSWGTYSEEDFEPILLEDMYYTGFFNKQRIEGNNAQHTHYVNRHNTVHEDVDAHRTFHSENMRDQSVDINWEKRKPISNETQLKYGVGIGVGIVVLMFAYDRMHTRIRHPQY